MKTISIVVPCYNEEENVIPLSRAITALFEKELADYRYELIFIDPDSRDRTRELLRGLCQRDPDIKAMFHAQNVGPVHSP